MKKLKPFKGHVVLKPLSEDFQQGKSNIIIPDTGNEKPILAEVIEVSEGIYNYRTDTLIPLEVKKGDIVIVPKMGAVVVTVDREDYYICQADQLAAGLIEESSIKDLLEETSKSFI